MIRNLGAVLAGALCWSVLWVLSARVVQATVPGAAEAAGPGPSSPLDALFLVLSVAYSVAAGAVTVGLASGRPVAHAAALGVLQLGLGIAFQASAWAVDPLAALAENVARVAPDAANRVRVVRGDVTELDLSDRRFGLAFLAFNSLLCIPDFGGQRRVLARIARHLGPRGLLVVDVVNPLALDPRGEPVPVPFFTRRHPCTGRRYTRFATLGPFDADHVESLRGWYDELGDDGVVRRRHCETRWRPIHRFELTLMLEQAGLVIESLAGGHAEEPYRSTSPRLLVEARLRA
jgi:SAM-dependent methyltransferase